MGRCNTASVEAGGDWAPQYQPSTGRCGAVRLLSQDQLAPEVLVVGQDGSPMNYMGHCYYLAGAYIDQPEGIRLGGGCVRAAGSTGPSHPLERVQASSVNL